MPLKKIKFSINRDVVSGENKKNVFDWRHKKSYNFSDISNEFLFDRINNTLNADLLLFCGLV